MARIDPIVVFAYSLAPNGLVLRNERDHGARLVSGGGWIEAIRAVNFGDARTVMSLRRVDTDPYADLMVEASPGIEWAYFRRNQDGTSTIVGNPLLFPDPNDPYAPFTPQQLQLLAEEQGALTQFLEQLERRSTS